MVRKTIASAAALAAAALSLQVCEPTGEEPEPVLLPVVVSGSGIAQCENDLGWTVDLTELRVAVRDLELTIEGETHASLIEGLRRLAFPEALAHPGHYAGGEVTGELAGDFVLDLVEGAGAELGEASLLPGDYNGVNLYFRVAGEEDCQGEDDPLLGHSAVVAGSAEKEGTHVLFEAAIDIEPDTQMVGGPFELDVDGDTAATLGLAVYTIDPFEDDTLLDGLDFGALDEDDDGQVSIAPGEAAHNVLMKTLVRHDHWGIEAL